MKIDKYSAHKETLKSMYVQVDNLLASSKTFKDIFDIGKTHNNHKYIFIYENNNKTKKIAYSDYYELCYKYAFQLKQLLKDIDKNDYVALKMKNSYLWCVIYWAILMSGHNVLIINPLSSETDTKRLIQEGNAKAIISDKNSQYDIYSINSNEIKISDEKYISNEYGNKVAFSTSGTTGDSRIFVFSDKNIIAQIASARKIPDTSLTGMFKKDKGDLRLMAVVPFSHIYGFVAVFLWYTFFGMTIIFPNSLSSFDIQNCAKKYKVTHIFGVPLLWDSLAKSIKNTIKSKSEKMQKTINKFIDYNNGIITSGEAGFASTKLFKNIFQKKVFGNKICFLVSGRSSISKETLSIINGIGYPLNNGYGMTEVGVTSVETIDDVKQRLKGSIGFPLTDVIYKIKDNELCIKSPQIHSYRLINGVEQDSLLDEEGFFHTGDIGYMDETEHTWIKGKIKDVVIGSNGENLYPDEIASYFVNLPFINKYTVVGLPINNEEIVSLIISLEKEINDEEKEKLIKEISIINNSFPTSMKIKKVYIYQNDLPVNTSMKILKYQIVDEYLKNPQLFKQLSIIENVGFEQFDQQEVTSITNKVRKIVSSILCVEEDKLGNNQNIITDLGGDSFTFMTLLSALEEEFDISIPTEMFSKLNTINDFVLFVLKNKH